VGERSNPFSRSMGKEKLPRYQPLAFDVQPLRLLKTQKLSSIRVQAKPCDFGDSKSAFPWATQRVRISGRFESAFSGKLEECVSLGDSKNAFAGKFEECVSPGDSSLPVLLMQGDP
jgi:hypothetical protein